MLQALFRRRVPQERLVDLPLLEILAHLAQATQREVGVYLDRHGVVREVVVSRRWQDLLAQFQRRAAPTRPVGLRYVGARPGPVNGLEEGDRRHVVEGRLDLAVLVPVDRARPGEGWVLQVAAAQNGQAPQVVAEGPYPAEALCRLELTPRLRAVEAAMRRAGPVVTPPRRERAVLVGLLRPRPRGEADAAPAEVAADAAFTARDSLEELARLADTAGADVVGTVLQARARPDPATYIGRGKVEEVRRLVEERDADLVVVDEELTPAQQRTLEQALGVKVLDRTALVLDIFARRAQTREGRLQVELAQLTYLLPRLAGRGAWLSRLGGGIGTRGPGETKLEVDRRRIRDRITELRRALAQVERHRTLQRRGRQEADLPVVAIVGYTNAGKSTLLNALTGAGVLVEDRLFATLDPTVRRVVLPNGRPVLFVDTVGFIHKLPTHLVAAFRATLEEVVAADVLVHVVDVSHPRWRHQQQVAERVLRELGAGERPCLVAYNKIDRLDPAARQALRREAPQAVLLSATQGVGLLNLLRRVSQLLTPPLVRLHLAVPYAEAGRLAEIFARGRVMAQRYEGDAIVLDAEVPPALAARFQQDGLVRPTL